MDHARINKLALRAHQRIALNIFTLRDQLGLSQGELAELAGIDRKSINRIENQRLSPSIDTLMRISLALGVKVSDLLI
jgi:transcriptional regulator with XRE-family HTH domain